jgi:hypothetical protein
MSDEKIFIELRDDRGRYADANERLCKCGHSKGEHVAGGGDCIVHELEDVPRCDCEKYRRAKK